MKNLIIIAAFMLLVACKKEETPTIAPVVQKPKVETPKKEPCDVFHYGDSCEIPYISRYVGNYTLKHIKSSLVGHNYSYDIVGTYDVSVKLINGNYVITNFWNDNRNVIVVAKNASGRFLIPRIIDYRGHYIHADTLTIKESSLEKGLYKLNSSFGVTNNNRFVQMHNFEITLTKKN